MELYSRLVANDKQLTYYDSGIGTYVAESNIFVKMKQKIDHTIDMAIATFVLPIYSAFHASSKYFIYRNHKRITLSAYQWLSENYVEGDRIYLFGEFIHQHCFCTNLRTCIGFSRGAYQVRIISGMIETVRTYSRVLSSNFG